MQTLNLQSPPALGIWRRKVKRRAAAYSSAPRELLVPGEDYCTCCLPHQPLLHLAGAGGQGGRGGGMRRRKTAISSGLHLPKHLAPCLPSNHVGSSCKTATQEVQWLDILSREEPNGGLNMCSSTCHIFYKKAQNLTTYISDTRLKYKLL